MDTDVEQIIAVAQLTTELVAGGANAMNIYLTATSGYLLVAYLAGKNLTRMQTLIITVLYAVFASFNTIAILSHFNNAFYFGHTYGAGLVPRWPIYGIGILFPLGILASLKFMWDVRHPKDE
jgi:hypothetical protein